MAASLLPRYRCRVGTAGAHLVMLLGLALFIFSCSSQGESGSLTTQTTKNPELDRQAVVNLLALYRMALLEEDIDRLQELLQIENSTTKVQTDHAQRTSRQEGGDVFEDAQSFPQVMTEAYRAHAIKALNIPSKEVRIADNRESVTFLEVESVESPATLRQQTRVFRTTFRLTQDEVDGVTTTLITAVRRNGPLVEITTIGQVQSSALTQVVVTDNGGLFHLARVEITVPETGAVHTLRTTRTDFRGTFNAASHPPPQPLGVRLIGEAGEELEIRHHYRVRMPGEGVVQLVPETSATRFFAVVIAPDRTVWAGGDRGASLYQVAPGATEAHFIGELLADADGRVEDLVFDQLGRLHAVVFSSRTGGTIVIEQDIFCQTVNFMDPGYPFRDADGRISPSTRAVAADGGDIWLIGSDAGIARVTDDFRAGQCPEDGVKVLYAPFLSREAGTLMANTVPALMVGENETLWIGSALGLSRLQNGEMTLVPFDPALSFQGNPTTLEAFYQEVAQAIFEARPLTTVALGGVSFVEAFGSELVKADLIFSLAVDLQERLWVGTLGGGLRRIEVHDGTLQETLYLTRTDGMTSNVIFALKTGPDGALWAATDEGVSRLREVDGEVMITTFSALDGLTLPVRDIAVDEDGTAWLATDGGLYQIVVQAGLVQGLVLDTTAHPVAEAVITVLGTPFRAVSNAEGRFVLANLPVGLHRLKIDGEHAVEGPFTKVVRDVTVTASEHTLETVKLLPLAAGVSIDPTQDQQVKFPNEPKALLEIAAGTAEFPPGAVPEIALTLLPLTNLPLPLPEGFTAAAAADLQPGGITFAIPAKLTLPNQGQLPAGQIVVLLHLKETTLTYEQVGFGRVSDDGTVITVISGGLSQFSTAVFATSPSTAQAIPVIIGGDGQIGVVGMPLPLPFEVEVRDGEGNPIPGVPFTFTVTSGNGTFDQAAPHATDAQGQVAATLTLGTQIGIVEVTVRSPGLPSLVFTATAVAGTQAELLLVSGDEQTGVVGTALAKPLVVEIRDDLDNPVSNIPVTYTVTSGDGNLTPTQPVMTDAQGQAAAALTLGHRPGMYEVMVTAPVLRGSPLTFTATGLVGAEARLLVVSGNGQTATVGQPLSAPLVVAVRNDLDNPVPDVPVTFLITSGNGSLSSTTVNTDANGEALTELTVGTTAGLNFLSSSAAGLKAVVLFATGESDLASARLIRVSGNNQSGKPGELLSEPFVVRVEDQFRNPIAGQEVTANLIQGEGEFVPSTRALLLSGALAHLQQNTMSEQAANGILATETTDARGEASFQLQVGASEEDIVVRVTAVEQTLQFLAIVGSIDTPDLPYDVAVAGDVAYIADRFTGLRVIDVSDPRDLREEDPVFQGRSMVRLAREADRLYVGAVFPVQLLIIDIVNPHTPAVIGQVNIPGVGGHGVAGVAVQGGFAYMVTIDQPSNSGTLQVVDINDPANAAVVGTLAALPSQPKGVAVAGNLVYVPAGAAGLLLIDISDPTNPILESTFGDPDPNDTVEIGFFSEITLSGNFAYLVETRDDSSTGLQERFFMVIDLTFPLAPQRKGTAQTRVVTNFIAPTIAVAGRFAYLVQSAFGLQAIDIGNPETPLLVGSIDTPSQALSAAATKDFIYVTDLIFGLQVIQGPGSDLTDTDMDGVIDFFDNFPDNPNEFQDTDQDTIGDHADPDDDNDGFTDEEEQAAIPPTDPKDPLSFPLRLPPLGTTTMIVDAASTVSARERNGTPDAPYRSITEGIWAIRALQDPGESQIETLNVRAGTYSPVTTQEIFPLDLIGLTQLTVQGAGRETTTIDAMFAGENVFIGSSSDMIVEGFTLVHGASGFVVNNGTRITLRRNRIVQQIFDGILMGVNNTENTIAENIISHADHGIVLHTNSDATMSVNTITDNTDDGILVTSSATATITANTITDNEGYGVQIDKQSNVTLTDNTITNNGSAGFFGVIVSNSTAVLTGNRIAENIDGGVIMILNAIAELTENAIIDNGGDGVHVDDSIAEIFADNTITGNGDEGVQIQNNSSATPTTNTITNNRYGLFIQQSEATVTNNTIGDNRIDGIMVFFGATAEISGNTLERNSDDGVQIQQAAATLTNNLINFNGGDGIFAVLNASATLTGGNTITNNRFGLLIQESSEATVTNNTIGDNRIDGIVVFFEATAEISGNTLERNGDDGVQIQQASATLTENLINLNGGDGVVVDSSTAKVALSNNTVSNNGDEGIQIQQSSEATISENMITGNTDEGILVIVDSTVTNSNNLVSKNGGNGIQIDNVSSADITADTISANTEHGVFLIGASSAAVGCDGSAVTIAQNDGAGIFVTEFTEEGSLDGSSAQVGPSIVFDNNAGGDIVGLVSACP